MYLEFKSVFNVWSAVFAFVFLRKYLASKCLAWRCLFVGRSCWWFKGADVRTHPLTCSYFRMYILIVALKEAA